MVYQINLTDDFLEEFEEICEYISYNLNALNASEKLREKVIDKIYSLRREPRMYTQINKLSKTQSNYRRIIINKYIVLYTIDDIKNIVYVTHIYYGGRTYIDVLL